MIKKVESGVRSYTADSTADVRLADSGLEACSQAIEYIQKQGGHGYCLLELASPSDVDLSAYIAGLGLATRAFGPPNFKIIDEAVATQSGDAARLAQKEVRNFIGFVFIQAAADLSDEQLSRREDIRMSVSELPFPGICVTPSLPSLSSAQSEQASMGLAPVQLVPPTGQHSEVVAV